MERERLLFRQPAFYDGTGDRAAARRDGDRHGPGGALGDHGWRGDGPLRDAGARPPARGCGHCRYPAPSSRVWSTCAPSTSRRIWRGGSPRRSRVVVIGGGFIGLEVAAAVRMLGKPVTVLEAAERLMGRVVAPVISSFYADLHRSRGVELVLDARIAEPGGRRRPGAGSGHGGRHAPCGRPGRDRHRRAAQCRAGDRRPASPARTASSSTSTAAPAIPRSSPPANAPATPTASPAGARGWNRCRTRSTRPRRWRPRSWAGPSRYDEVPWFWSDQYEVKLQMVGISTGHDQLVLRGDPASGQFSVCYFRDGRLHGDQFGQPAGRPHDRAQAAGGRHGR